MADSQLIIQKLWNFCSILRDDGLSYWDYMEQLTFLLFLKMADERQQNTQEVNPIIPEQYNWQSLKNQDPQYLSNHYQNLLNALSNNPDYRIRRIFSGANNKIQDPAKLQRLIFSIIDQERWTELDTDVKGGAYEWLLQKTTEDTKGTTRQHFTPRPLIQAIVDVMRPEPGTTICDPACGTGGFLLAAYNYISNPQNYNPTEIDYEYLINKALHGHELVDSVVRLALMNLALHDIDSNTPLVELKDSLLMEPGDRFDMVITDPPVGKLSSDPHQRKDFWATTNNKQLNFVQHIYTLLKENGKAAVVIPDNVLFESGAGKTIRENLLRKCDVHTLLRLPTGVFYAHGANANILFFDRKPASETPWTTNLWIYDFRTNQNFTLKETPLKREDLDEFVRCFNAQNRFERKPSDSPQGRWQAFPYEQLIKRDKLALDIFWIKDDVPTLDEPDVIAERIYQDLKTAMERIGLIHQDMNSSS